MDLQDDFGRTSEHQLRCRLHALSLDVAEDVVSTSGFEQVVHEADATARVDAS